VITESPTRQLKFTHDIWMDSLPLPIHSGYYIEDLRQLALGHWAERGCDAAFIQLEGQQGITEPRISELPPRAVGDVSGVPTVPGGSPHGFAGVGVPGSEPPS